MLPAPPTPTPKKLKLSPDPMKTLVVTITLALLPILHAADGGLPDVMEGNKYNGGRTVVTVGTEDDVERLPQKVTTFGKQSRVIQIEIPVKVPAQWRRYYIANFVQKYASTLNRKIGMEMELAVMSDTPNEKMADAWEAQEIVVPAELEELPENACPSTSYRSHNGRVDSWEQRALTAAEKDFLELKKKIGSAK